MSQRELVFQLFSSGLNIRPYNRLDKEVADFKEHKSGPAVSCTTKCFHHQDGEDADNDKKCKTYTQHQRQIEHCRTIAYLLMYTQCKKKVGI